jgi:hypothetical protein
MKQWFAAALMASALATASTAGAVDFSFTGTLANDDAVGFFDFSLGTTSLVTLRTYSYAGGVNAAGMTIARGGFDPSLFLYDLATGARIGDNDDGGCTVVAADAVTGECWDSFFQANLLAGNYRVAIVEYDNFGPLNLSGIFPGSSFTNFADDSGVPNNPRDGHWAADALIRPVPEPATWALMIGGFGLAGAALRRRRAAIASRT